MVVYSGPGNDKVLFRDNPATILYICIVMENGLTAPQKRVLEFITFRIERGDGPPTFREICQKFGYRSPKAAADHVGVLERKGYLRREHGRARGIKLVNSESGIPLMGRIAAGSPSTVSSETESMFPLDPSVFGIKDQTKAFALRVNGDSMTGRHIFDGDVVVAEYGKSPKSGDIVVALIDNESTLKTLIKKDGAAWLQAENPLYPALIPSVGLTIQGVVRAVVHWVSL
jgi:repressor LexA